MLDVGHRSPNTRPQGARGEVGERARVTAPVAARSLHLTDTTWLQFCTGYRPHLYGRRSCRSGARLVHDANELQGILSAALTRMSDGTWRRSPPRPSIVMEETSAGSCYNRSAA